jgi:hypothetical protein
MEPVEEKQTTLVPTAALETAAHFTASVAIQLRSASHLMVANLPLDPAPYIQSTTQHQAQMAFAAAQCLAQGACLMDTAARHTDFAALLTNSVLSKLDVNLNSESVLKSHQTARAVERRTTSALVVPLASVAQKLVGAARLLSSAV